MARIGFTPSGPMKVHRLGAENLVPVEGIEPPFLSERDFELRASTSSATRARACRRDCGQGSPPNPRLPFEFVIV